MQAQPDTTQEQGITGFLQARIAEDEAEARSVLAEYESSPPSVYEMAQVPMLEAGDPERVLAECEAKRRIIAEHPRCDVHDRPGDECDACLRCGDGSLWPCGTLLALASVYGDHPDYDQEWA